MNDRSSVIFLAKYSRLGASSRLRSILYAEKFKSEGHDVEISPYFDSAYLNSIYANAPVRLSHFKYMFRRLLFFVKIPRADVIFVEKELFPWLPWFFERWFYARRWRLIVDYDDAIFHRYDLHRSRLVRLLLGRKIDRLMARADCVLVGSHYLMDRAQAAGAKRVIFFPTVVDTEAYAIGHVKHPDGRLRVGWIGSPSTWREYGALLVSTLKPVLKSKNAIFRVVGSGLPSGTDEEIEYLDWSEDGEVELIQGMDVGVMPLEDTLWARGKCGYKLIQYMACGVPVVASPVGENNHIFQHGKEGYFASNSQEWAFYVDQLLIEESKRNQMGLSGRQTVSEKYSFNGNFETIKEVFMEV